MVVVNRHSDDFLAPPFAFPEQVDYLLASIGHNEKTEARFFSFIFVAIVFGLSQLVVVQAHMMPAVGQLHQQERIQVQVLLRGGKGASQLQ